MVATSPAVANLESGLGKYSITTRRAFCTLQPTNQSSKLGPETIVTVRGEGYRLNAA